ncbi:MAG: FkbM family methyltransferase [Pseudomonadota bacterium]|jgi:FkbM family methyltransferase|nr:FkbM family methyltransferase [Pseudomonadota bacterium]
MKDAPTSPKFIRTRGLRFPYDPQIITRKRRRLMRDDHYEHKESEAVLRVVKPDDTVIELGAGMGYMSTLLAKKLGVKTVHAFEANPRMIPYIHAVHAANGVEGVTVHNAILGAADGRAKFYVRGDFVASSLEDNLEDAHGGVIAEEEIDIRNAQAVFDEISPTVLVCDIEGAEADLLPLIDLSGLRCAIVELHPQWIGQAGVQAVFDAMQAGGLTYYPRMSNAKVVTFRKGW